MGLPELMIVHVGRGPETLWTWPDGGLPWIRKKSVIEPTSGAVIIILIKEFIGSDARVTCVTAEVQYINKSSIPKQKNNGSRDKTSQSKRL